MVEPGYKHFMGVLGLQGSCLGYLGNMIQVDKEMLQGHFLSLQHSDLFVLVTRQSMEKERHPNRDYLLGRLRVAP